MSEMSADEFSAIAEAAVARIPADLTALLDNVVLLVEDDAPAHDPHLLGLYEGIPLTHRDSHYAGVLPDRITLYRRPLLRHAGGDPENVRREIEITVVHEIAHYFGIDDEALHAWGYG